MTHFLIIFIGGGLGAGFRHLIGLTAFRLLGSNFPWGTIFVNVVGSLAMGIFIALLGRKIQATNELRLLISTGFLGGFTTFSAFSLEVAVLWERGSTSTAFIYVLASVVLSISAVFAGLWLVRSIS
jgi:CrcB protein